MNTWLLLLAVVIGLFVLLTIIGLIKNIIRTGLAVLVGYLVAIGLSYGATAMGITGIPDIAFIVVGGIVAFSALLRMNR